METAERDENYTVMEPVTTYSPVQVDQGYFVEQQVYRPGPVRNRLQWQSGACVTDPLTGRTAYQRGGLFWTPTQQPGVVQAQRVWQPNLVTMQVPQTSYAARVVTRKVPIQVCRYVDEEIVRKVPVQVCRMVQEEQVRRVPYTVCRQVTERVENKVPVKVCRMQPEEVVRKIPVTTMRMVQEEKVEQLPVQVCRQMAVEQTIQVPQIVRKQVPVTYSYRVPRTVVLRVPVDPCGNELYVPSTPTVVAPSVPSYAPPATNHSTPAPAPPRQATTRVRSSARTGPASNSLRSIRVRPCRSRRTSRARTTAQLEVRKRSDRSISPRTTAKPEAEQTFESPAGRLGPASPASSTGA